MWRRKGDSWVEDETIKASDPTLEWVKTTARTYLRSTSKRTFVVFPLAVLSEQAVAKRSLHFIGVPLMAWGYLQYRFGGNYRTGIGGGGPGVSGAPPEQLVTSGIYKVTRNPMYTGHIIFLLGLTLSTLSPLAFTMTVAVIPWFRARIIEDEKRLLELFGSEYAAYMEKVGRWGPKDLSRFLAK